jgi:thiol-disulfide isomerase/thioredoxin
MDRRFCAVPLPLTLFAILVVAPFSASFSQGERILADFEWTDLEGKSYKLSDFQDSKGVVFAFSGIGCPLVNIYAPKLEKIHKEYKAKGFNFFWVNSNSQDTTEELAQEKEKFGLGFPAVKDEGNRIADILGAERTTEVFVIDPKRVVRYRGRIDTQYGIGWQRADATENYLVDSLDALIANKPIQIAKTEAPGCIIGRTFADLGSEEVTYSNQISRVFQRNCIGCHREGEIGPFELTDYESAKGWARMIGEVVNEKRMPPWKASPEHGTFANNRSMSPVEIALIDKWIENGAPEGDPAHLPEPIRFTQGWSIGEPDEIVEMPVECTVASSGTIPYQYFGVNTDFGEDKWITAAEVRAGNSAVVHHILVFIAYPKDRKDEEPDFDGGLDGYFLAAVPGEAPAVFRDGMAKFIPQGATLVFQIHYTANGTVTKDRSKIGLIFADEPVKKEVHTRAAFNKRFRIPPHEPNHVVTADFTFDDDVYLLQLLPHMHVRGKKFTYTAKFPDGKEEILLHIPEWDFGWQNGYRFAEPLFVPKGTEIFCEAVYDNSENNPANPDPSKKVRFGDQTWDEMLIGYFDYYLADQDLTKENTKLTAAN